MPRRPPVAAGRPIVARGRVGEPPRPCDERSTTPSRRTFAPATARDGSCGWPLPNREDTAGGGPGRANRGGGTPAPARLPRPPPPRPPPPRGGPRPLPPLPLPAPPVDSAAACV